MRRAGQKGVYMLSGSLLRSVRLAVEILSGRGDFLVLVLVVAPPARTTTRRRTRTKVWLRQSWAVFSAIQVFNPPYNVGSVDFYMQ